MRHDPQRFVGKTVRVPHFNLDTVEYPSRERDESKPGIKTLLPFLENIAEDSELEDFEDLIVALVACYWLHNAISVSSSRFGDDRRCDFSPLGGDFLLLRRFHLLFGAVFICIFLSPSERDLYFIPRLA